MELTLSSKLERFLTQSDGEHSTSQLEAGGKPSTRVSAGRTCKALVCYSFMQLHLKNTPHLHFIIFQFLTCIRWAGTSRHDLGISGCRIRLPSTKIILVIHSNISRNFFHHIFVSWSKIFFIIFSTFCHHICLFPWVG